MAQGSGSSRGRARTTLEEHANSRSVLWRKAALYTPLALAFGAVTAMALYYMLTSSLAAAVGALVFGLPAFALGFEALSALRDLRARPVVTRGVVARLWSKGTVLWMTRAYYVLVETPREPPAKGFDKRFFVISQEASLQLDDGRTVEVEHWPHTNTVIRLDLLEPSRAARAERPGR